MYQGFRRICLRVLRCPCAAAAAHRGVVRDHEAVSSSLATRTMRSVLIGSEYPVMDTLLFYFLKSSYCKAFRGVAECYAFSCFHNNVGLRDLPAIRHIESADAVIAQLAEGGCAGVALETERPERLLKSEGVGYAVCRHPQRVGVCLQMLQFLWCEFLLRAHTAPPFGSSIITQVRRF